MTLLLADGRCVYSTSHRPGQGTPVLRTELFTIPDAGPERPATPEEAALYLLAKRAEPKAVAPAVRQSAPERGVFD